MVTSATAQHSPREWRSLKRSAAKRVRRLASEKKTLVQAPQLLVAPPKKQERRWLCARCSKVRGGPTFHFGSCPLTQPSPRKEPRAVASRSFADCHRAQDQGKDDTLSLFGRRGDEQRPRVVRGPSPAQEYDGPGSSELSGLVIGRRVALSRVIGGLKCRYGRSDGRPSVESSWQGQEHHEVFLDPTIASHTWADTTHKRNRVQQVRSCGYHRKSHRRLWCMRILGAAR